MILLILMSSMSKIKVDKKDFNDIDIYHLGYEYKKKKLQNVM